MENQKIETVESNFAVSCHIHPRYKGLRKPRTDCPTCWAIYGERKASGTVERRIRVAGRGIEQRQELSTESVYSYVDYVTNLRSEDQPESDFKEVAKRLYLKNRKNLLGY